MAVGGLILLSLLWACGSLQPDLLPNLGLDLVPRKQAAAIAFWMLAAVAAGTAWIRQTPWPRRKQFWIAILIGLGLFVVPSAMLELTARWTSSVSRTALFTLVPFFSLVLEPHLSVATDKHPKGGLAASVVAVAGALLIFPVRVPGSIAELLGFFTVILAAACIGATNCAAVAQVACSTDSEKGSPLAGMEVAPLAAIAGAVAAVAMCIESAISERPVWHWNPLAPQLLWSAAIELPALLLLFWLMKRMTAMRMATRYLLFPLFAILIGALLLRSPLQPRTSIGLLLMALGSGWLLLAPFDAVEGSELSLR